MLPSSLRSYLNLLLVCLPLGIWAGLASKGAIAIFSLVRARAPAHALVPAQP